MNKVLSKVFQIILTGLFCLLFSDTFSQVANKKLVPPKITYYLKTNMSPYTILKYNSSEQQNIFDGNVKSATISLAEIREIEKLIKKRIDIYNKGNQWPIIKSEKYFKQFITVINPSGEKIVWVNCMCQVIDDYWKKHIPHVSDGGSCYFRLKINLSRNEVYDFYTNGLG